jgi:uncharacterized protein (TIGR02996 family)
MHPEADAFLDAIFAHPDDDTPRLVYADWLHEHDQENYARFIRLQCAVAREKLWSDEANRLWEEIGRVWHRLDEEWWPATREKWGSWHRTHRLLDAIHFERGLLRSDMEIGAGEIEAYPACRAWLPACQVSLPDIDDFERLANMPIARRLKKVVLSRTATVSTRAWEHESWLTSFAISEYTRHVRVLDLSAMPLRDRLAQSLLHEKSLPELEELHVRFGSVYDCDPDETTRLLTARYKRVIRH